MGKKILVTKEWHKKAMACIEGVEKCEAWVNGLQTFLATKLTPEQQKELEAQINRYLKRVDTNDGKHAS